MPFSNLQGHILWKGQLNHDLPTATIGDKGKMLSFRPKISQPISSQKSLVTSKRKILALLVPDIDWFRTWKDDQDFHLETKCFSFISLNLFSEEEEDPKRKRKRKVLDPNRKLECYLCGGMFSASNMSNLPFEKLVFITRMWPLLFFQILVKVQFSDLLFCPQTKLFCMKIKGVVTKFFVDPSPPISHTHTHIQ